MRTPAQVRARRLALVSMAALGAVALSACGLARSSTGGSSAADRAVVRGRRTLVGRARAVYRARRSGAGDDKPGGHGERYAELARRGRRAGACRVRGDLGHVRLGRRGVRARYRAVRARAVHVDRADARPGRELGGAARARRAARRPATRMRARRRSGASGSPARNEGFVFGNGLWVTTDGGERWTAIAEPGRLDRRPRGDRRPAARAHRHLLGAVRLRAGGNA